MIIGDLMEGYSIQDIICTLLHLALVKFLYFYSVSFGDMRVIEQAKSICCRLDIIFKKYAAFVLFFLFSHQQKNYDLRGQGK